MLSWHEKRALEPKWGHPNFEAFLRAKHDEIRAAHLAYRIPSLDEKARAFERSEALTEIVEYVQREANYPHETASVRLATPLAHPQESTRCSRWPCCAGPATA